MAQLVQPRIDHRHLRAERDCRLDRVLADDAGAEHDDVRGRSARQPGHQLAAAGARLAQILRRHFRRHASGDLAHRDQQRQRAVRKLHRLVGDRRDLRRHQYARQFGKRRKVQVREKRLPVADEAVLLFERLLHLHQQVAARPHFPRALDHRRARCLVRRVRAARA